MTLPTVRLKPDTTYGGTAVKRVKLGVVAMALLFTLVPALPTSIG